jgi:phage terminase large subunit-like protein
VGGVSRDQAEIGYRQAEGMILAVAAAAVVLEAAGGVSADQESRDGRADLQVFAADDKTGDGIIPTDAFLDELHRQKDLRLYRTWRGKLDKRGGQMATISTAGEPGHEFEETRS